MMNANITQNYDAVTMAFLAMRDGVSTPEQDQLFYNHCAIKASVYRKKSQLSVDVDEFLSRLMLLIWDKRDDFDPTKASFSTWAEWRCMQINKEMWSEYKTNQENVGIHLDKPVSGDDSSTDPYNLIENRASFQPEQDVIAEQTGIEIIAAINELSSNYKNAIMKVCVEGLEPGEAAKALNREKACFYRDLSRAREKLYRKLVDRGVGVDEVLSLSSKYRLYN